MLYLNIKKTPVLITSFTLICLFLSFHYVKAEEKDLTEKYINHIKSLGFIDCEIDFMANKEIEDNMKLDGEVISEDIKFYKVSEY